MPGKRFVVCLSLLIGASIASAYEPDVTQQRDETVAGASDRLIPDGSASVRGRCMRCLAEFGRYPSSEPASEWQIQLEDKKYVLSSWRLVNPKSDVDARQVDVLRFEVSRQFAEVVYDIWANNILEARYTRHAPSGADAVSYRFRTHLKGVGWPSARTGVANKDLPPKWLVDTGEEILTLARAKSPKETPVLAKLQAARKRLNEYYHPPPRTQ
ncbi:hypothetical protein [Steroidobacter agaridevorans]|uniref:hypothetical protein n=1 Tax=Steroidobacter agaridevorans TaxID=2695856 RepID=UPI001328665B|nr:hypothetical protein [Steroidobacter agaridevorans]GFE88717.1 hypothetical protein GCM10011488_36710 [Steroidobacter agaridevorans]